MNELDLLLDLHLDRPRQGPGSDVHTRFAIDLSGLQETPDLTIADIGCGTGASTRVLAQTLGGHITAVDFLPPFLERLESLNAKADLGQARIETLHASMDALPFAAESLDAIWSEGAIYNMGFVAGLRAWRPFLKPNGILAVSELTWLTATRPKALQQYWDAEYPEVDTAVAKIRQLEDNGFSPIGYFSLPNTCWLDHYYRPLQTGFDAFLARHAHHATACTLIEAHQHEIQLYEDYKDFFSYGYYVAKKVSD